MRQALHIFKKDVRFLRTEIGLLLMLAAVLGWTEAHLGGLALVVELLVLMTVNYTIARVVHAEAIPGHNQFWITRPYSSDSLLGAKILFILVFVNVPIFAAQCYIIGAGGFNFASSCPGLIWSQVLMIFCISLPVFSVASLTAGLMPFLLAEFVVAGGAFAGGILLTQWQRSSGGPPVLLAVMQPGPAAMDWVRDTLVMAVITCLAIAVLRWQYRTRQTERGRRIAFGGLAIAAVVYICMPWPVALGVQSKLSKVDFDGTSLKVRLASVINSAFPPPARAQQRIAPNIVSLPMAISSVSGNPRDLQADSLSMSITGADGRTWNSGSILPIMPDPSGNTPNEAIIDGILHVNPAFFAAESSRPVTVRAQFYFTLYGNPQSMTIPIVPEPVNVMDGLQCAVGFLNQFACRSIFRWPRRRVSAKTGEGGVESYIRGVSYSPFPAELGIGPIEQHSFSTPATATKATVTTQEPMSHFPMEVTMADVSLADYTAEAKRRALMAPPPGTTGSGTK